MKIFLLLSAIVAMPALAGVGPELDQDLYTSQGIASPGFDTGFNSAGISYNGATKLSVIGTFTTPSTFSVNPAVIFGSNSFAGLVGYTYPSNLIEAGVGGTAGKAVALGLKATAPVTSLTSLTFTPGLIVNPTGKFRVGAAVSTSLTALGTLGLGLAFVPSKAWTFALDAETSLPLRSYTFTPGITVGGQAWHLTAAYDIALNTAPVGVSGGAFQLGAAVVFGKNFFLQARTTNFTSYLVGIAFALVK